MSETRKSDIIEQSLCELLFFEELARGIARCHGFDWAAATRGERRAFTSAVRLCAQDIEFVTEIAKHAANLSPASKAVLEAIASFEGIPF